MTLPANGGQASSGASPERLPHSLGALLAEQVRRRGHQPLMTFYGASGERTELSYATFDNWASKTANLLTEELNAGRLARIALGVRDHWTGAVVVAAAWKVGALIIPATVAAADVIVVAEADVAGLAGNTGLVVIGAGMAGRVEGSVDGIAFGNEVLAFADDYDDPAVSLDDPALLVGDDAFSQAEQLRQAWGTIGAGDRLLSTEPLESAAGVILGLLAPIAAGASLVWCPGMDDETAREHASAERATHVLDVGGIAPL